MKRKNRMNLGQAASALLHRREQADATRVNYPRPLVIYRFGFAGRVSTALMRQRVGASALVHHTERAAAKYLPAAPKVDGVRCRWEKGRLVPRVRP